MRPPSARRRSTSLPSGGGAGRSPGPIDRGPSGRTAPPGTGPARAAGRRRIRHRVRDLVHLLLQQVELVGQHLLRRLVPFSGWTAAYVLGRFMKLSSDVGR